MRLPALVLFVLLALVARAQAENEFFLSRDETVPAETYLQSDGGVVAKEAGEKPWDTFVSDEVTPPAERFELWGPWPIRQTSPQLQTFVTGPTFRNQANRIEVGAGFGYINSRWRFPFELSVEPTWRRNKNVPDGQQRNFYRVRTFGLVELWDRSSKWESTAFAVTGFYDTQENSFNNLEFGGSVSQTFGRRLTISGNLAWGGDWPDGGDFNNAAFGSVSVSYNAGAGFRLGGFYEPDNNYTLEDDFGGFISYQSLRLPFAELVVNVGKHDFVSVRLIFSFALERP